MKFSVLMSVYAKEIPDFFELALKSITIEQSLKPTQVVIVEDGPVPKKIDDIIEDAKLSSEEIEFTVLKLEKNQGLAAALNYGLNKCKYEYIARMDSDDISMPYRFQKQCEYLELHKEVDVLGGCIAEFDDKPDEIKSIRKVGISQEDIIKMSKKRTPFNHMTVFYKKSKLKEVGGYSVEYGKLEDYKLWIDLICNKCILRNMDEILVKMRVGNGLLKRRSDAHEIEDWDKLQLEMLKNGLTNKKEYFVNRINIRIFTKMPIALKKIVYSLFLRKRMK